MKKYITGLFVFGFMFLFGFVFASNVEANTYIKKIDFNKDIGTFPRDSMIEKDGKLYGLTNNGGMYRAGVIFEWDPATNEYIKKYDFGNGILFSKNNGVYPGGSLALKDGKFYGTTVRGGKYDQGVIFEWDPVTNIYVKKIDFDNINGAFSDSGSLTLKDGKFYGMTKNGGKYKRGVIFEWDPVTNIYVKKIDLNMTIGCSPYGSLTLKDGKFYGMTSNGGEYDSGVIFEWNPGTNKYIKKIDFNATIGTHPGISLVLKDGKFFGTTNWGGKYNLGVIFEWDPSTNIYTKKIDMSQDNGSNPRASLILVDNIFYGLTREGGTYNNGVIFKWDPITNLYQKQYDFDYYHKREGRNPYGAFSLFGDKLYGMTYMGGQKDVGTIFEFDPAGVAVNLPPVAKDVNISGTPIVGNTLTGSYRYFDEDGDLEGTSTYRWFRDNVVINGATSINYTTTQEDANKWIAFEVTPVAKTGASPGKPIKSEIFVKENSGNPCLDTTEPLVTVIYPNGGEDFLIGDEVKATWKSCNIPSNHNLFVGIIYEGHDFSKEVVTTTVSGTTEEATLVIPSDPSFFTSNSMEFGTYYTLLVRDLNGGTYAGKDYSDEPFSIYDIKGPKTDVNIEKDIDTEIKEKNEVKDEIEKVKIESLNIISKE